MRILLFACMLLSASLRGQTPDTLFVEPGLRIVSQTLGVNGDEQIYRSPEMDTSRTVYELLQLIHENERLLVDIERKRIFKASMDKLYDDVNNALKQLGVSGYVPNVWQELESEYTGIWTITRADEEFTALVQRNATILRIDKYEVTSCVEGEPVPATDSALILGLNRCDTPGGKAVYVARTKDKPAGILAPVTVNSFLLLNLLDTTTHNPDNRLIRLSDDAPVFFDPGEQLVLKKIQL